MNKFFKPIWHYLQGSVRALRANKTRTMLTILGIVIGIATVIIVYSAGEGTKSLILNQISSFGTDIISIQVKVPNGLSGQAGRAKSATALAQGVQITTMGLGDLTAIKKLPNVINAYAAVINQDQVSYQNQLRRTFLMGTSASYLAINKTQLAEGNWFSEDQDQGFNNVVVLGSSIANKLFGQDDPLNKYITVHQQKFLVIGVLKSAGAVAFINFDDFLYVPVRTLQKKLMGINHVSMMVAEVQTMALADQTAADITATLRARHNIDDQTGGKDDFSVVTMAEAMKNLDTITNALTFLLLGIVAISLVVGGVGIMNIMYVAVTERTAEIGLRKAVGATYSAILTQFLVEAILITVLGGIIGIAVGIGVSFLISLVAQWYGLDWTFVLPAQGFAVSLIFSFACGLVFGVYPARTAARLDPVEALRNE